MVHLHGGGKSNANSMSLRRPKSSSQQQQQAQGSAAVGAVASPVAPLHEIHVAVLGMNGVGKSALTVKYITKRFITEYDPNLEDTYCKHDVIDGHDYMVWVMDTVEGANRDLTRYQPWADIYMVVYSVTSAQSFQYSELLLKQLARHEHALCVRDHARVLIGTKTDLERYRQVSKSDGAALAEQFGADFFELNSTESYGIVKRVFHAVIASAVQRHYARMTHVHRSPSPRNYSSDPEMQSCRTLSLSAGPCSSRKGSGVPPTTNNKNINSNGNTSSPAMINSLVLRGTGASASNGAKSPKRSESHLKAPSVPPRLANSSSTSPRAFYRVWDCPQKTVAGRRARLSTGR